MNNLKEILYICFLLLIEVNSISQTAEDDMIVWNENETLAWSDFKGEVDANLQLSALSSINILPKGEWSANLPDIKVTCFFDTKKSWTRDTSSYKLLLHEQLHFDIGELYTRKIRKKISELRKCGIKEIGVYNQEIQTLLSKYQLCQNEYDKETKHGILEEQQKIWDLKIANELLELQMYSIDN
jgi:hypothetical protein